MVKGSQLTQLKSALSQAGVTGRPSTSKKRKRSAVPLEKEKEKRVARLEEIHRRLNPFDVKITKTKHDVGGRKVKGMTGKPAQSKQAGIEQRKKTLLKEWEERNRSGGIVDRRFGENDPTMSLEERMLERFTRERQRASKGVAFNLEDEDELTHYGQSLSKLDDFDNVGLGLESDEEDMGQLDQQLVSQAHFGGFEKEAIDPDVEDEEPARKKSKAEVMAEVIAKSKEHKILRQMEKEQEENIRHELDNDFATLRDLLYAPDPSLTIATTASIGEPNQDEKSSGAATLSMLPEAHDAGYDQHVRELAFDKRSKPKDRTKTEEELALEEKEALEIAEKQRRKRMLGIEDSGSEDEGRGRRKRVRGGDDLEDDFRDNEVDEWGGLGSGLDVETGIVDGEGEASGSYSEDGEDSEDGKEGYEISEDEEGGSEDEEGEQEDLTTSSSRRKTKAAASAHQDLPFTFPAPGSHEEFLDIIENVKDQDVPLVVQRIRTLYHTSFAPENKFKLQTLANILIEHILYVTTPPAPRFPLVSSLLPHLKAIVKAYPISAAQFFNEKLSLMDKNLKRGLSRGALSLDAKTWPGPSELILLRIIGLIWPTSDLNHAVISPSRLLMGAYLGLCRVRCLSDLASGLFLCTLFLQYESLSRRFVPEAVNFLVNAFLHLSPTRFKSTSSLPGSFSVPDFRSEACQRLRLNVKKMAPMPHKADLSELLMLEEPREQDKVNLIALVLELMGKFAELYKGLDGFVELYSPLLEVLEGVETKNWEEGLKARYSKNVDMLTRLLKFATDSHVPLALQAHKPIPIPSYIPKFESTTSNYLRKKDPDHEKNEAAKLRYQLKQEKKGAIRELRKDARFLASVEQKRQLEKDRDYNERLKKAFTSIESERAEQKAMEREKAREKRRAVLDQCCTARDLEPQRSSLIHGFNMTTDIPSGSAFPVPTFNGSESDASINQFLDFLRTLVSQYLSENSPRIPSSNKAAWITVINGLTDHLLSTFPLPDSVPWDALHEKAIAVMTTVDVVKRVFERVDGIHQNTSETIKKITSKLLSLCFVLELWSEVETKLEDEKVHPKLLRERCFEVLVVILRGLGGNALASVESSEPSWRTLRTILLECLELSQEFMSKSMHLSYPLTLSLFNNPRFIDKQPNDLFEVDASGPFDHIVPSSAHVPTFLSNLIQVVTHTAVPPLLCEWFIADLTKRILDTMKDVLDFTLSPLTSLPLSRRAKICGDILVCSLHLQGSPTTACQSAYLPCFLVRQRLYEGPKDAWELFDQRISEALQNRAIYGVSKAELTDVMKYLCAELWGTQGNKLRNLGYIFLRDALKGMKCGSVDFTLNDLASLEDTPHYHEIVQLISRSNLHPQAPVQPQNNELRSVLEGLGHSCEDMMDDDGEGVRNYMKTVVQEITDRLKRSLHNPSEVARLETARNLAKLPCLVSHCDKSNCQKDEHAYSIPFTEAYLPIMALLLDGDEDEVVPAVRRETFRALKCAIEHHPVSNSTNGLDDAGKFLLLHIGDTDRGARLSACYGLVALVSAYAGSAGNPWQLAQRIFRALYQHMAQAKENTKETALIAVGQMGKTQHPEILGQVLCFLIAQLGQSNPVIKGMANIQLSELTKYHKKTPYTLVLPYLDHVAQFSISRISASPSILTEACKFLSLAPGDFISVTASRTFPELFSRHDPKGVDAVARLVGHKASTLFLQHSPAILAKIFISPQAQEAKAISFVLKILADASQSEVIDLQMIVRLSLVKLLGELVIYMGDENPEVAEAAINAVTKIERIVNSSPKADKQPAVDLGTFLKAHMLGLISQVNDMLQDVHGKKTVVIKRKIIRGLGALIAQIGPTITYIMATFQTMICVPEFAEATLQSWHKFLTTLDPAEIGPHVGPTSAAFVSAWCTFTPKAKQSTVESMAYIVEEIGQAPDQHRHLDDIVDISFIPEFSDIRLRLEALRRDCTPQERLQRLLDRSGSENLSVAIQSLGELKTFLQTESGGFVKSLISGDMFDSAAGQVIGSLLAAASRDGDGIEPLRNLAYECLGILGAVDPDRCELPAGPSRIIVKNNFIDEEESMQFALHLICDLLVGAFRSTSDIKHQGFLAYTIQELLKFCQFKPALVGVGTGGSISNKVRNRWKSLPKHILETVTPLLEGKFTLNLGPSPDIKHPIYFHQSTYREWIQLWTAYLIDKASGPTAQTIFNIFRSAVRNKDAGVAHHLLPHLVLNILIGGNEEDAHQIRNELMVVLQDQIDPESPSSPDKKLLSAQAVFMLLDHLNAWVRVVRQDINTKKVDSKRTRGERTLNTQLEEQLTHVDSILTSIDHHLMAQAAFQCKAFARSLMHSEQEVVFLRETSQNRDLSSFYERLHEIYAHLDEPDGMEGMSTLILSPSLEHQIRQHESTGQWTSAQSCWEVRLQQSPDNVEFHLGLLRCLRNLGHYDTLRTHVRGVLTRKPEWGNALAGFQIESAWMVGAWDEVESYAEKATAQTAQVMTGRVLLAMRRHEPSAISTALRNARAVLGSPITAAGPRSYRRSYDAALDLHLIHELELIHQTAARLSETSQGRSQGRRYISQLTRTLDARLDSISPTFRFRELVLSMRRTAFSLLISPHHNLVVEIGKTWLASAKIARKAGQWQTAYSAMLQAQQSKTQFAFLENAKLVKATNDPVRALSDLENSMNLAGLLEASDFVDLTIDDPEAVRMKSKALILRARWMRESQRYDPSAIYKIFQQVTEIDKNSEKAHFYLGQFHDEIFKSLSTADKRTRGLKMIQATMRAFTRAVKQGSKYLYQTVPRLLTLWLDLAEGNSSDKDYREAVAKCHELAGKLIREWYIAFPQIVSRVGHPDEETYLTLSRLILKVLEDYPKQALWIFASVVKSTKPHREQRGRAILEKLKNNPKLARTKIPNLVHQIETMTNELLALCDRHIDDEKKTLHMRRDFPHLAQIGHCDLIIPLQESLTASLPPASADQSTHRPFPSNLPMFSDFYDEIDIMRSLAKPRKISIRGTDGQTYTFLGKPKDDLRKDARLMEFNSIINKQLKANSESRKRQLRIRTYGVVTLNEECGFIQWVPNTIPLRPVLMKGYDTRRIRSWTAEMGEVFRKIKDADDHTAATLFVKNILPKQVFPFLMFHEWFLETFPEPSAWLTSRMTYGRTAAVMSMVGFILGLGDRHCENILLDTNTGDVVHVDFNCLFEKGKSLETPERVPFRLTQNLVDGLGVTGVEGFFRTACEVTLQLLRDNKDSLMNVLDSFIHDPLVEWEDEKRRLDRQRNQVKTSIDSLAKTALSKIEKKLKGIYVPDTSKDRNAAEKEVTTGNLVQILIQEATDDANLAKMYPGWASWH
ncbi:hypothetical protein NP233_g5503 [Leucocoprinus birnbaumii]|uniref:non-specific serine/threonine protein kinase n=1 Tax=Leucocoprinus birnbaumii TaxID=56174 RepID=A0AAD5VZ14_9AGAR|nr:hypothetical protein NP233_g5503 [Leucocoprinus birnbaumii]